MEGSSGEYEASARKRRSAETHNRNPTSSFSRRLPVGTNMLARKRMWAVSYTGAKLSVAQIGQSEIIITRTGRRGNGGMGEGCRVGFPRAGRGDHDRRIIRDSMHRLRFGTSFVSACAHFGYMLSWNC